MHAISEKFELKEPLLAVLYCNITVRCVKLMLRYQLNNCLVFPTQMEVPFYAEFVEGKTTQTTLGGVDNAV